MLSPFCSHPPGAVSLDQNDLTFMRLRTKKHEIMVAPGA
jgi:hypothetical protein